MFLVFPGNKNTTRLTNLKRNIHNTDCDIQKTVGKGTKLKLKTVSCTTVQATILCTVLNLPIILISTYIDINFIYIFLPDNFILILP
jgi:hypothetical protein